MERDDEEAADDEREAIRNSSDEDEQLDRAAQGEEGTSDAAGSGTGEIDKIGNAAGLVVRDDKPFRGIEEVERRDVKRWEENPESADDGCVRGTD